MDDVTTDEVASVGRRIAGQLINSFVPSLVVLAVSLAGPDGASFTLLSLLLGPGYLALEIALLHRLGGHLGHLVLGMRAVTSDGLPSLSQAAIRVAVFIALPIYVIRLAVDHGLLSLADLVWSLVLLASLVRDVEHRALHDKAAGTTVVLLARA